jgi:hypothetical protein
MSWVEAIKKFAEQNKSKFAIPKRDSPEYGKIRQIQEEMAKNTGLTIVKPKKKAVAAAPVAVAAAPVVAKVTKPKIAKKENVPEPEVVAAPVAEVKVFKKSRVVPKPAEKVEVVAEVAEPVPEVKVKMVKRKIIKRENQEAEPAPEPMPEVKKMTNVQEERAAKRLAKQARLEEQSKKAGEHALAQARISMAKQPVVVDFS